jgi:hypothetical protein
MKIINLKIRLLETVFEYKRFIYRSSSFYLSTIIALEIVRNKNYKHIDPYYNIFYYSETRFLMSYLIFYRK